MPKVFFFSRLEYIKELPIEKLKGVSLIKVKFEDIKDWSDLVTPQGIMGQWLFTVFVERRLGIICSCLSQGPTNLNEIENITEPNLFLQQCLKSCESCILSGN